MAALLCLQMCIRDSLTALAVNDLTLGVHDVVVLQHRLTGLEVPGLHPLLSVLDGVGQHLLIQRRVVVHAQRGHHALSLIHI